MPLTDTAVKKAKPGLKPVKLTDGKGLYLLVNPVGSKLWHQERNEVSAAYNHATYLKQRGKMMQHWSDHLDTCTTGKVLPFKRMTA